ncbi:TetR/AcrR family transcriptional regulator [Desulfosporosinus youngiae]|uniref:Transcriptional regulator n=1 Tax=Desulfosporosinus youngiae DSM 17734 TaxID=768710 RepID=H5Y4V7_9FIRM|nr:TetR/AcrR family transcriptional regulator [Desulfosporosinus youngiae]EHQ89992.1 transcriptional regulator [Desulfosporosinus youngiae DSM 17734]
MENNGYGLHRKDRLVITTIEIIDQLGIQGLSTREIARRQGVSEATLFRHFKSKNQLLLVVLEDFSKFDIDIYQSIKLKELRPKESITYLIRAYAEYYESYPAITSIMQVFDVLRHESELTDRVKSILNDRSSFMKQLIEEAQKAGEISPDMDSKNLADVIWGLCREICLTWRLNGQSYSLKERTLSTLEMVLKAFS